MDRQFTKSKMVFILALVVIGMLGKTDASSRLSETSHFATYRDENMRIILNNGEITYEHTTPWTNRYLGPDTVSSAGSSDHRSRRDITLTDGPIFDTFEYYVPLGKHSPVPFATVRDGVSDLDSDDTFTAPFCGTFFFLYHGPLSFEDLVVELLVTDNVLGRDRRRGGRVRRRDDVAELTVSNSTTAVLPVLVTLDSGDFVELELTNTPSGPYTSLYSGFNLYHCNVLPTSLCFPHQVRQSAFSVVWRNAIIGDLSTPDPFLLENGYDSITNVGAHFNIDTGIYTVKYPGLYAFFVSFLLTGQGLPATSIVITRNGNDVVLVSAEGSMKPTSIHEGASTAVVLELKTGDAIQLKLGSGSAAIDSMTRDRLVFTGFLL